MGDTHTYPGAHVSSPDPDDMWLMNIFASLGRAIRTAIRAINNFRLNHPILFYGGIALAIGTALPPVLGAVGFSTAGPVAGSLAAQIQSACYGGAVAKGSLFALAQSTAMGGLPLSACLAGSAACGKLVAGAALLV